MEVAAQTSLPRFSESKGGGGGGCFSETLRCFDSLVSSSEVPSAIAIRPLFGQTRPQWMRHEESRGRSERAKAKSGRVEVKSSGYQWSGVRPGRLSLSQYSLQEQRSLWLGIDFHFNLLVMQLCPTQSGDLCRGESPREQIQVLLQMDSIGRSWNDHRTRVKKQSTDHSVFGDSMSFRDSLQQF
jgi:hypothetical protein